MREIVSPLDGIRSPLGGTRSPFAAYFINGQRPSLIADFRNNVFATRSLDAYDYALAGQPAALVASFRDNAYLTSGRETMTAHTRHGLITSGRSTTMIVRDSDGIYKHGAHNLVDTRLDETGQWTQNGLASVTSDGVGAKGEERFAVVEDTGTGSHQLQDFPSFTSGRTYTIAVDVAPIGSRDLEIVLGSTAFGASVRWLFDLSAGTVTRIVGGTNDSARMVPLGNGEYRCELTIDATATSGANVFYRVYNGSVTYTGDGASGLYLSRPIVYESSVGARPELVTNGTFASDIAGWTDASDAGGAISWNASGHMDLVYITGTVRARQDFAVVSGKRYRVTVERISGGVNSSFYVGSSSGAGDIVSQALNTAGVYVFDVTATTSTFHIDVRLFSAGTATVDNISVIPIPDAMQPASDGEKWIPNETGAALYAAPVDYDVNGACPMPIWEARTNLFAYPLVLSDASWSVTRASVTENAAVSPDGTQNADKLVEDATASASHGALRRTATYTAGLHTFSFYAKAAERSFARAFVDSALNSAGVNIGVWFDLSSGTVGTQSNTTSGKIVPVGNGWYRCSVEFTANAGASTKAQVFIADADNSSTYNGDGTSGIYLWLMQVEAGLGASPPMNGGASTFARAADDLYTLVSSFGYRQSEGTIVAEFESVGSDGADFPRQVQIDDGTENNRLGSFVNTSNDPRIATAVSGSGSTGDIGAFTANTPQTFALGFKSGDNAGSANGATVGANTAALPSGVTHMRYGVNSGVSNHLNGKLYSLVYYPFRAANSDLEAASA